MAISSVVTNIGRAMFADRLRPTPQIYTNAPRYLAMGVGATGAGHSASVVDTALISEVEVRAVGTDSLQTSNVNNDTYQLIGTMVAAGGSRAIDESAIFDSPSNGNMFTSTTFNAINLNQFDSIVMTWRIQLA